MDKKFEQVAKIINGIKETKEDRDPELTTFYRDLKEKIQQVRDPISSAKSVKRNSNMSL